MAGRPQDSLGGHGPWQCCAIWWRSLVAWAHLEQHLSFSDTLQPSAPTCHGGHDYLRVTYLAWMIQILWELGYADQAQQRSAEALGQAEACFQQALDVARRLLAKALELRAALSLARLWQGQGKRAAARLLLAERYRWFTEGFDTADLQEAKACLDAL